MKISWVFWWIVNGAWLLLSTVFATFLWLREVDGAGAVQTTELKLISILILAIAFIFPFIIQVVWALINFVISRNNKQTMQV